MAAIFLNRIELYYLMLFPCSQSRLINPAAIYPALVRASFHWDSWKQKEELATLTNLMLPTQAIKLVESYCPYLTTGSRFEKRILTKRKRWPLVSIWPFFLYRSWPIATEKKRRIRSQVSSSAWLVIFKARHPRRGTWALISINAMT